LNKLLFLIVAVLAVTLISIPVNAAITTNAATVNATCVVLSGTNSGPAEQVYFVYGHISNGCQIHPNGTINMSCTYPAFSSSTLNSSATGTFTARRCDEPTFLPSNTYKYQACGRVSGCGATLTFTMNPLVPHATTTFSQYGEAFISNGGDLQWVAMHIWDVYSMIWGSYFMLLLIAFIFMNIVIKQKSITIAFLLMLISGGVLLSIAPPEMTQIAYILMALAMAGLMFWLIKGKR